MPPCKWKKETTLRLIGLIEANDCLWKVTSPEFKNRVRREKVISSIAAEMRLPAEEIRRKIHSLRSQFTTERSKMTKLKSGDGAADRYQTKWEYYNAVQFMYQHSSSTETWDSMQQTSKENEPPDVDDNGDHERQNFNHTTTEKSTATIYDVAVDSYSESQASTSQPTAALKRKIQKRNEQSTSDMQEAAAINRCMEVLEKRPKSTKDEHTIFGEYVANELRLLKDVDDVYFTLKSAIQKSIIEANDTAHRMRKNNTTSATSTDPSTPDITPADDVPPTTIDGMCGGLKYTILQNVVLE